MALDPVVNFFRSTIATLPLNSGTTTMVLASGDGNKLPDPSVDGAFNLVVYDPSDPFVAPEIVRCTARTSDTLTISRGQEGTSDATKAAGIAWTVELVPTAKTIQDIDSTKVNVADIVNNLTSTDTNKPLSANQGKVLQDGKVATASIVNDLTSGGTTVPLSAEQGKVLQDNKVAKAGDTMTGTLTATKLIPSGNVTAGNGMYLPATNTLAFSTDGSEAFRVTSAQRVGINTTSPENIAQIRHTSTDANLSDTSGAGLSVLGTSTLRVNVGTYPTSPFAGWLQATNGSGNSFPFVLNPLGGDVGIGNTAPASKLHVTGLTRSTSGINFNASGGSTLSSYEEGTWTPTLEGATTAGTYTYSDRKGVYTRVGNLVYVQCDLTISGVSSAGSGNINISGLPFTSRSDFDTGNIGPSILYHFGADLGTGVPTVAPLPNNTKVLVLNVLVDGTQSLPAVTNYTTNSRARFRLVYQIV